MAVPYSPTAPMHYSCLKHSSSGEAERGGIVLQGAQLRPSCPALGSFQGVVGGDPLWLTVINNNAQRGIVHLVAVERPLLFRGLLCVLKGLGIMRDTAGNK